MTETSQLENQSPPRRAKILMPSVLSLLWLGVVAGLTIGLMINANSPGKPSRPPLAWPKVGQVTLNSINPTLVMFAHPKCPCTRATIGELAKIMAKCQGLLSANVVFIRPQGASSDWAETDLKKSAAGIFGVEVFTDSAGMLAKQFQCFTSGTTLLYDQKGKLIFQGGITLSQGHSGDNPGENAIVDVVQGRNPERVTTPVFGCGLFDSLCLAEID